MHHFSVTVRTDESRSTGTETQSVKIETLDTKADGKFGAGDDVVFTISSIEDGMLYRDTVHLNDAESVTVRTLEGIINGGLSAYNAKTYVIAVENGSEGLLSFYPDEESAMSGSKMIVMKSVDLASGSVLVPERH